MIYKGLNYYKPTLSNCNEIYALKLNFAKKLSLIKNSHNK